MTETHRYNEVAFRLSRLNESDLVDEDSMTWGEAYDSLLEAYQEARDLNRELEEMIHEYIQTYGAL